MNITYLSPRLNLLRLRPDIHPGTNHCLLISARLNNLKYSRSLLFPMENQTKRKQNHAFTLLRLGDEVENNMHRIGCISLEFIMTE